MKSGNNFAFGPHFDYENAEPLWERRESSKSDATFAFHKKYYFLKYVFFVKHGKEEWSFCL